MRVYPHPKLIARGEYLAGIGSAGADVDPEQAAELIAAGLATETAPPVSRETSAPRRQRSKRRASAPAEG